VITIPRTLARLFRTVLRQSVMASGMRGQWPLVLCQTGETGFQLHAQGGDIAVAYRDGDPRPADAIAFSAEVLERFEGRTNELVNLEQVETGKALARWNDVGVPCSVEFETVTPDSVSPFPKLPERWTPMPEELLPTLNAANRTAARESARFALARLQLRGRTGQVVATDGKQLLVQAGFRFPWEDDLLVPRLPAFGQRELQNETSIEVGRTEDHVAFRLGNWILMVGIDKTSRYPNVQQVVPRASTIKTRLRLEAEDAKLLASALSRLPGVDDENRPVTLDLSKQIIVRAAEDGKNSIAEVPLTHSIVEGTPSRLCLDRTYVGRALQLGFTEFQIATPDHPILCRDKHRLYLFMPLDAKGALPPVGETSRILATSVAPSKPDPSQERSVSVMPPPSTNGHTANDQPERVPGIVELITEAEALRSLLHDAASRVSRLVLALKQQQKRSRAVHAAMASLRQLQQLEP
jgi:hypothetical protein